jgi:hypothetical protein
VLSSSGQREGQKQQEADGGWGRRRRRCRSGMIDLQFEFGEDVAQRPTVFSNRLEGEFIRKKRGELCI